MGLEFTWHYFTKINFSVDSKLVLLGWQNDRDLNQVSGSSLATVKPSAWRDLEVDSVAAFSRDGQFLAAITEERTEIYSTLRSGEYAPFDEAVSCSCSSCAKS